MENLSCLQAQFDEIEALQSIYGDLWKADKDSPGSHAIEITENRTAVTLYVQLNDSYPLFAPPTYTISAPILSADQKHAIANLLDNEYLNNIGECVLYQWVEKIREYLAGLGEATDPTPRNSQNSPIEVTFQTASVPDIISGECITDRKSVFQGHVARVTSVEEVTAVLQSLKCNRKIANATHNIYAYRISLGGSNFAQDCDDDGETQAGGRLLHLLQILNVTDVIVVVSRWYGGVQLGPDRFRHINNAARQVLQSANFISPKKSS